VQDNIGNIPPEADAHHHIGLEPPVVPLFFQIRFEVGGAGIHTDLEEALVEEIPLGRQAPRCGRVAVENQDFHGCKARPYSTVGFGALRSLKQLNASVREAARASQLLSSKP